MRSRTSCRCSDRGAPRRLALVTAALLALLALAPSLGRAADRYVAPNGEAATCSQAVPCSLATGVKGASDGDVVHVPGDLGPYPTLKELVQVKSGVDVVGEGAQMPQVPVGSGGTVGVLGGGTISGLALTRIEVNNILFTLSKDAIASRMRLESALGLAAELFGGTLRDSVVRYTGTFGTAIQSGGNPLLRNLTVLSTRVGSGAIRVYSSEILPSPCTAGNVQLRNVIVRGADIDLQLDGASDKCPATIDVGYSNFRPDAVKVNKGNLVDAGGNQTAVEALLDADGIHQLAGSPTIDAGIALADNGPFDFDGEPRLLGNAPDIGADEFPSPPEPVTAADTTAPVGSALQLSPRRFRPTRTPPAGTASRSAAGRKPAPRGSRVTYALSEAATVRFTVKRRLRGVRKGKRCLTSRAARRKGGRRCSKLVAVGRSFSGQGLAGANAFRFTGHVGGRRQGGFIALRPGAYRLVGVPSDAAGNSGTEFGAQFAIVG